MSKNFGDFGVVSLHGWKWRGEKGSCQEVIHSWPNTIHQSRSACFPNMCGSGSSGMPCMCHVAVYGLLLDTSFIYGLLWSHTLPHTTTSSYLTRNASFHQPKLQFLFQWCHNLRKNACEKANFCLEKKKQYQFIIFTALLYKHKEQLLPKCSAYFSFSNGNKKE